MANSKQSENKDKASPPRLVPFDLRLGSVSSCRKTQSRILREHARGTVDERAFRSLTWGLSSLIAWFRIEVEQQLEERVKKLEEIVSESQDE